MKSTWRAVALALVLGVCVVLGLSWHVSARSTDLSSQGLGMGRFDLDVAVFTENARITLSIDSKTFTHSNHSFTNVSLEPSEPTRLLIVSSHAPSRILASRSNDTVRVGDQYLTVVPRNYSPPTVRGSSTDVLLRFDSPERSVSERHGVVVINLPAFETAIGADSYPTYGFASRHAVPAVSEIYADPRPRTGVATGETNPRAYVGSLPIRQDLRPSTGSHPSTPRVMRALFWAPHSVKIADVATDAARTLSGVQIQTTNPFAPTTDAGDVVWRTTTSNLSPPRLVAVSRELQESKQRDEFLSGIALATGAAALIALLQEGPDEIPTFTKMGRRTAPGQHRTPDDPPKMD
jgi:hypothetical protein